MIKERKKEFGFTLVEVAVVIVIIGIMASIALQSLNSNIEHSRFKATTQEMEQLKIAILGDSRLVTGGIRTDFGYVGDVGALPPSLTALIKNPGGYKTWNGPYIDIGFSEDKKGFMTDAWGKPYKYTKTVIKSTGGKTVITKKLVDNISDIDNNSITGQIADGLGNPPSAKASEVTVKITYPNGKGKTKTVKTHPSGSGNFRFFKIPVGNHTILSYTSDGDSSEVLVSVLPRSSPFVNIRFPGDLWGRYPMSHKKGK